MMRPLLWLPLFLLTLLAACATPERIVGDGPAFDRTGRFSVTAQGPDEKLESVQGGFAWYDAGHALQLNLANPMGSTLAQVRVEPGQAVLVHSNGSQETAPTADELVARVVGGPVPVAGLRSWLRGEVNSQAANSLQKNSQGQVEAFSQEGWQVRLQRYDTKGPRLIDLKRTEQGRSIRVRLVIDA